MYAVFEDGSRQYRVSKGDVVTIDLREADKGDQIELNRILLYANGDATEIGQPVVEGARVLAEVVGGASKKYIIQKLRRRKNSRRRTGHRQKHLKVLIRHILLAGEEPVEEPEEEKVVNEAPQTEETPEVNEDSSTTETSEAPEQEKAEATQETESSEDSEQEDTSEEKSEQEDEEKKKDE